MMLSPIWHGYSNENQCITERCWNHSCNFWACWVVVWWLFFALGFLFLKVQDFNNMKKVIKMICKSWAAQGKTNLKMVNGKSSLMVVVWKSPLFTAYLINTTNCLLTQKDQSLKHKRTFFILRIYNKPQTLLVSKCQLVRNGE